MANTKAEWRNVSWWLIAAGGGAIASVLAAYILHFVPPERALGGRRAAEDAAREAAGGSRHAELLPQRATDEDREAPPASPAIRGRAAAAEPKPGSMTTAPRHDTGGPVAAEHSVVREGSADGPSSTAVKLSADAPFVVPEIDTVLSLAFRETLGSPYAEFVVDAPGQASLRFPARSGGAAREFEAHGRRFEIRVVAIDWRAKTSHVTLRPITGS